MLKIAIIESEINVKVKSYAVSYTHLRRPTSAQLSRAVKADEISVVEPTQPLRLARQSKDN